MQERRNSIANALELRLFCSNPPIFEDGPSKKMLQVGGVGKWLLTISVQDDTLEFTRIRTYVVNVKPESGIIGIIRKKTFVKK